MSAGPVRGCSFRAAGEGRVPVGEADRAMRRNRPGSFSYFQRLAGFFQWIGAHVLGAVGRQPKLELTESMPAAMFAS
jgi:hypothetical protein